MGYRKAAWLRRRQDVSKRYRTSSKGETYWVNGHMRNNYGSDDSSKGCAVACFVGLIAFFILWIAIVW